MDSSNTKKGSNARNLVAVEWSAFGQGFEKEVSSRGRVRVKALAAFLAAED